MRHRAVGSQGNRFCLRHTVEQQLADDFENEAPKKLLQRDLPREKKKKRADSNVHFRFS